MERKESILKMNKGIGVIKPLKKENYELPTEVIFGRGALDKINHFLPIKDNQKILLVTGNHFKQSNDFFRLKANLIKTGEKVIVYREKISTSDFNTIDQLADYCRTVKPDLIIAIGGGTILDTAKCAAILAKNKGLVEDYVKGKTRELKKSGVTLIAVPTTAGTGSEVTPWATAWDMEDKKKYSLTSPLMFPFLALVDPQLTDCLPPKITAETGLDALAQAIEAYWSVNHNFVSDKFALAAIKLDMETLEKVVNHPDKNL